MGITDGTAVQGYVSERPSGASLVAVSNRACCKYVSVFSLLRVLCLPFLHSSCFALYLRACIQVSKAEFKQKGESFDDSKRLKVNDARVKVRHTSFGQNREKRTDICPPCVVCVVALSDRLG